MYNLRMLMRPATDYDYLSWPIWHDHVIKLPEIKKLKKCSVHVVADLLDSSWEILGRGTIEQTRNITLNFLEYLAIKQSIKEFIKNASKKRVNMGPYIPYMLNLAFSQKKGCHDIYRKTGQYGDKLLKEISLKWETNLMLKVENDEIKHSISLLKKTTRNMY